MKRDLMLLLGFGLALAGCPTDDKNEDDTGDVEADTDVDTDTDTDTDTEGGTDPEATLASLAFDAEGYDLVLGESAGLTVTGTWDDGSTSDETGNCSFSSSDDAVAQADGADLWATGEGATDVSCVIDAVETSAPVTVSVLEMSGRAHLRGHGLQGVELWVSTGDGDPWLAGESDSATGAFTASGLGYGTYTVTPSLMGNVFVPASYELEIDADTDLSTALDFEIQGQAFPTADDGHSNNDMASAEAMGIDGALITRTIWPWDQEADWFSFELAAGGAANVFTAHLAANTDSYLTIYEADGETEVDGNDDCHNGYDSCVAVESEDGGTYYGVVTALSEGGVVQYHFGIETWTDADEDGFSTFHDCDDADELVGPYGYGDEATDGVDYDCDGIVRTSASAADAVDAAGTDEVASPRAATYVWNNPWNLLYANWYVADTAATLPDDTDVDRYAVEVPANSAADFYPNNALFDDGGQTWAQLDIVSYEPDGVTELDTSTYGLRIENSTASDETYYVDVALYGTGEVYYIPSVTFVGYDLDEDGYYSQDWDSDRDCDDADNSVTTECYSFED